MASNPHSPLNQEHLNQINHALRQIEIAESQITMAKQAGIDVAHFEKQLEDARQKLRGIKNTYFPGAY